jgi:hypothetical protein
MSSGQKNLVTWCALILLVAYLANVNPGQLIGSLFHSLQVIHNQNAHP